MTTTTDATMFCGDHPNEPLVRVATQDARTYYDCRACQSYRQSLRADRDALLAGLEACVAFYVAPPARIEAFSAERDKVIGAARKIIAEARGRA